MFVVFFTQVMSCEEMIYSHSRSWFQGRSTDDSFVDFMLSSHNATVLVSTVEVCLITVYLLKLKSKRSLVNKV